MPAEGAPAGAGAGAGAAEGGAAPGAAAAAGAASALALLAAHGAAVPPRAAARHALVAAGLAAGALTGAGFPAAAAAAAEGAVAATSALKAAAEADTAAQAADVMVASATQRLSGGDGGLLWALQCPSEWVTSGLALIALARSARAVARGGGAGGAEGPAGAGAAGAAGGARPAGAARGDAEASAALASLFSIPQWRAAGDLLVAALGGTVGASELTSLSPATAFAVGVLGCSRGAEALAVGRPGEALPLFEAALVALSRRFLPLPGEAGGGPPGPFPPASLTLARASALCTGSAGGLSLLPPRAGGGGAAGGSVLASAPLPRGFLPDPADLIVEAAVGACEALRKLPPGAPAGGASAPPTPPIVVATGLLEATLRAAPSVLLRPGLLHSIAMLYEAGRDAMAAAAAKRVLAAIAGAWGVSNMGPEVFRLPSPPQ
jgi:hypothetical protein